MNRLYCKLLLLLTGLFSFTFSTRAQYSTQQIKAVDSALTILHQRGMFNGVLLLADHGKIIYQDKVSALKRSYLTSKQVDVRYAQPLPADFQVAGTDLLKTGTYGVKLRFDTRTTGVESVITRLATAGELIDVTISDPSLEEVIRTIYQQADTSTTVRTANGELARQNV